MPTDSPNSSPREKVTLRDVLGQARSAKVPQSGEGRLITIQSIDPNPYQHRTYMDPDELDELTDSIRVNGLLEPVVVRQHPDHSDRYQLIAGERRWTVFKTLCEDTTVLDARSRFGSIPAVLKANVTDRQMRIWGLVENGDRADASPVEQGSALSALQDEGMSLEQIVAETGWAFDRVKRLLRLAGAPQAIKDGCTKGVMVPLLGEDGEPLKTPKGRVKQEHRHLDLIAGLEFASLYVHWVNQMSAKRATERIERVITKALTEGWSLRRVQQYCREAKASSTTERPVLVSDAAGEDAPAGASSPNSPAPFRSDDHQLIVYHSRLATASSDQKRELRVLLIRLVESLE